MSTDLPSSRKSAIQAKEAFAVYITSLFSPQFMSTVYLNAKGKMSVGDEFGNM
jgi:hypothetical protein